MRILFVLLMTLSCPLFSFGMELGSSFANVKLEDQFGADAKIPVDTKFVVFVWEKLPSRNVTELLQDKKIDLTDKKIVYVSDISPMPSMITKMFAIPKMRKLGFKMALDRSGEVTKAWPRESGKIAVLDLADHKLKSISFVTTKEELTKALSL